LWPLVKGIQWISLLAGPHLGPAVGIEKLSERVAKLETWLAWLKGGWAALLAAYMYIYKKF
jgi:hypothetical protein